MRRKAPCEEFEALGVALPNFRLFLVDPYLYVYIMYMYIILYGYVNVYVHVYVHVHSHT